jgi:hypothetical protein
MYPDDLEERRQEAAQRFAQRAVKIARRDGIPERDSDEIRIHQPLENDPYISTDKVMVSFRTARGQPVALLEQLFSDDERTHIVDRNAIAVDPTTGYIHDMGLFFQRTPGDYTSVASSVEIKLDKLRRQGNAEKKHQSTKMNGHVIARLAHQSDNLRALADKFAAAAQVMGVKLTSGLAENRNLFKIAPSSQVARDL